MQLVFELSKEHPTLPRAEVLACLNAHYIPFTLTDANEDALVVDLNCSSLLIDHLAKRLAFTFLIDELLFRCPATIPEILTHAQQHPLLTHGSLAIRVKNRSSTLRSEDLIDHIGDIYTKDRTIHLKNPDIELRVLLTDTTAYVGIKKATVPTEHFQTRRGHHRPFLQPITLHPKLARGLVNLSSIQPQELLLDPFCGTGGILLEAGLIGASIIGSDVEQKMIDGCTKTLEYYHVKPNQLLCTDIGRIPQVFPKVDAVVTDFPYGKSTTTKKEQITQLYDRAFSSIEQVLKKKKYAVIGIGDPLLIPLGERYLTCVETHAFRMHRSLTRYFTMYQKQ